MQNAQLLWAAGSMFGLWGSCYPFIDASDSELGCTFHLSAALMANLYILEYYSVTPVNKLMHCKGENSKILKCQATELFVHQFL